jgi:hypothetical protein
MTTVSDGTEPPRDDGLPPRPPPPTASGLDEQQIHPEDIAALQALFKPRALLPGVVLSCHSQPAGFIPPGLLREACHAAGLTLGQPRNLRLRFVPLPDKVRLRKYAWPPPKLKLRKDLQAALACPVLRRRLHVEDLPRQVQKALFEAMFRKYGEEARGMAVRAVFAHIPPEAAPSAKLGPELEVATFLWPANLAPAKAKAGHYLVVLAQPDGKTRNVIFRLE